MTATVYNSPITTNGTPRRYMRVTGSVEDRFWARVQKSDGCWTWNGAKTPHGYGTFNAGNHTFRRAHRFAWELTNGPIPKGHDLCHICDNPSCVRPDHLFIGTERDNMRDMSRKGRAKNQFFSATHCRYGHELTPENTRIRRRGDRTYRSCRECQRVQQRTLRASRK